MKIHIITAAHERFQVTEYCYKAWCKLTAYFPGIEFKIFSAVSCIQHIDLAREYGVSPILVNNKPLGNKWNKVLEASLLYNDPPNWIITMGSDDVLNVEGMNKLLQYMTNGVDIISFNELFIIKWSELLDKKSINPLDFNAIINLADNAHVTMPTPFGAGRAYGYQYLAAACIGRMEMSHEAIAYANGQVQQAGKWFFIPGRIDGQVTEVQLWPPDSNSGLDHSAIAHLERGPDTGLIAPLHVVITGGPYIMDIKSETNIHSFESLNREEWLQSSAR